MKCGWLNNYSLTHGIIFFQTEAKDSYPRRRNVDPQTGELIIGGVDFVHVT